MSIFVDGCASMTYFHFTKLYILEISPWWGSKTCLVLLTSAQCSIVLIYGSPSLVHILCGFQFFILYVSL